jgi:hypothetical protein
VVWKYGSIAIDTGLSWSLGSLVLGLRARFISLLL